MDSSQISYRASWDEPFADIPCSYDVRREMAEKYEGIILPRIETPEQDAEQYEPLSAYVSPVPGEIESLKGEIAYLRKELSKLTIPQKQTKKGGFEI